jgi:hypothetical protein
MKLKEGKVYRLKGVEVGGWRVVEAGGWLWVCVKSKGDSSFKSIATGITMSLMSPENWLEEADDENR